MTSYEDLADFLERRMRMSRVYQPLLIRALVDAGGTATLRQLAAAFLLQDESQLLFYEDRIKKMPLSVLRHGIVQRNGDFVRLTSGSSLTKSGRRSRCSASRNCRSSFTAEVWRPGITG